MNQKMYEQVIRMLHSYKSYVEKDESTTWLSFSYNVAVAIYMGMFKWDYIKIPKNQTVQETMAVNYEDIITFLRTQGTPNIISRLSEDIFLGKFKVVMGG